LELLQNQIGQTVDAVVIQSGHILLVNVAPDRVRGLAALPGGFIRSIRAFTDGCIRELRENQLKIPDPYYRCIKASIPLMSRTARHRSPPLLMQFLIELPAAEDLPKVKVVMMRKKILVAVSRYET